MINSLKRHNYIITCFDTITNFNDTRIMLVFGTLELSTKFTINYVGFWFFILRYFVLLNSFVTLDLQKHVFLIKLDICHFSYFLTTYGNYVTITFRFVRHCEIFYIASQLRYLFVRCSYVFDFIRITLYFGTFELRTEIKL